MVRMIVGHIECRTIERAVRPDFHSHNLPSRGDQMSVRFFESMCKQRSNRIPFGMRFVDCGEGALVSIALMSPPLWPQRVHPSASYLSRSLIGSPATSRSSPA
jgi:hypothetical protein